MYFVVQVFLMSKMYNTPIVGDLYVFVVQGGWRGGVEGGWY